MVLFLDDLQWADTASIDAVNQLLFTPDLSSSLSAKQGNRFFFLGCCREGGIDEQHPLWSVFCHAELLNVKYTNLQLRCFEEKTLNSMVSETLCLSPRITQSLSSIIYHKTKGNPLFVSRLMLSLSKDGLLRPNLNRRRWEWDKEKIQSQKLPEDVAMFITSTIEALPEAEQDLLLPRTLLNALSRFSTTASIPAVSEAVREQCDIEADKLDSELSMVRYISWAIPSIGFIGTVRGIGDALGQAYKAVEGDISGVTVSLGVAFNSTFVALVLSIIIMFALHQLQLSQERLVLRTQRYADKQLIRHLAAPK